MIIRTLSRYTDLVLAIIVVIAAAFILASANRGSIPVLPQYVITGADPSQAPAEMTRYGCGSCHTIPGVSGANALVGPSLEHYGSHSYIAGQFSNQPDNLIAWLENPQAMIPGNAMPNMNVSEAAARDMAAYLYNQR